MSEIENARRNLQICGYQHPSKIITNTDKQYKIFNTESKNEDYTKSKRWSQYATFTEKENKKLLYKNANICPTCGGDALYACDCKYKDKQCSNGHVWFINKDKKIVMGDPHD